MGFCECIQIAASRKLAQLLLPGFDCLLPLFCKQCRVRTIKQSPELRRWKNAIVDCVRWRSLPKVDDESCSCQREKRNNDDGDHCLLLPERQLVHQCRPQHDCDRRIGQAQSDARDWSLVPERIPSCVAAREKETGRDACAPGPMTNDQRVLT